MGWYIDTTGFIKWYSELLTLFLLYFWIFLQFRIRIFLSLNYDASWSEYNQVNKLHFTHAAAAKSLRLCPTLCDPTDDSPPGSLIPGILQARTLEWVAISFSNGWKWKVKVKSLSCVWPSVTPWTASHQAPPTIGFSRQEYWSGVPSLSTV